MSSLNKCSILHTYSVHFICTETHTLISPIPADSFQSPQHTCTQLFIFFSLLHSHATRNTTRLPFHATIQASQYDLEVTHVVMEKPRIFPWAVPSYYSKAPLILLMGSLSLDSQANFDKDWIQLSQFHYISCISKERKKQLRVKLAMPILYP